jgi:hypothetical protein
LQIEKLSHYFHPMFKTSVYSKGKSSERTGKSTLFNGFLLIVAFGFEPNAPKLLEITVIICNYSGRAFGPKSPQPKSLISGIWGLHCRGRLWLHDMFGSAHQSAQTQKKRHKKLSLYSTLRMNEGCD